MAEDAAPPIVFLDAFLTPDSTGGKHFEGDVVGRPDLHYSWYQDELAPRITRKSDGRYENWFLKPDNKTFVDRNGRIVAHIANGTIVATATATAFSGPELKPTHEHEEPSLCPEPPMKDKAGLTGKRGERSKAYENCMKEKVNPKPHTPPGLAYYLPNAEQGGRLVSYDDCQRKTGDMHEFKGPGFAEHIDSPYASMREKFRDNVTSDWLDQATRQVQASQGRHIIWSFAEERARDYASKLFNDGEHPNLERIALRFVPCEESDDE